MRIMKTLLLLFPRVAFRSAIILFVAAPAHAPTIADPTPAKLTPAEYRRLLKDLLKMKDGERKPEAQSPVRTGGPAAPYSCPGRDSYPGDPAAATLPPEMKGLLKNCSRWWRRETKPGQRRVMRLRLPPGHPVPRMIPPPPSSPPPEMRTFLNDLLKELDGDTAPTRPVGDPACTGRLCHGVANFTAPKAPPTPPLRSPCSRPAVVKPAAWRPSAPLRRP